MICCLFVAATTAASAASAAPALLSCLGLVLLILFFVLFIPAVVLETHSGMYDIDTSSKLYLGYHI